VKHIGAIAGRELQSLFFSPVAYVVLTLWSVLAATFFLSTLIGFQEELIRAQQLGGPEALAGINLNDHMILPFIGSMWIVLVFTLPAVTMGLFASEKANGTEELLLTCPLTIWEIVLGKFAAGGIFGLLMTAIVGFFPGVLFLFGEPELGKTLAGLLALFLVTLTYVAAGAFASSLTRNQLIAFLLGLVLLLVFGMMLPFIVEIAVSRNAVGSSSWLADAMRYASTGEHFEQMLRGLIDTRDLAYFAVVISAFLLLTKTAVESVRWR
jgi:ABC-2 type transport system permease protein